MDNKVGYYEVTVKFERKRYKTGQIDTDSVREHHVWANNSTEAEQLGIELTKMCEREQLINPEKMVATSFYSDRQDRR